MQEIGEDVKQWQPGNRVRLPDEIDFVDAASLGCRFITSLTTFRNASTPR